MLYPLCPPLLTRLSAGEGELFKRGARPLYAGYSRIKSLSVSLYERETNHHL